MKRELFILHDPMPIRFQDEWFYNHQGEKIWGMYGARYLEYPRQFTVADPDSVLYITQEICYSTGVVEQWFECPYNEAPLGKPVVVWLNNGKTSLLSRQPEGWVNQSQTQPVALEDVKYWRPLFYYRAIAQAYKKFLKFGLTFNDFKLYYMHDLKALRINAMHSPLLDQKFNRYNAYAPQ